jgi:hypothetical protein
MEKVYKDASVLLRIVPHDGLPRMVLEALSRGRPVVYNHPFPNCTLARNVEESIVAIANGLASGANTAGAEHVRKIYADDDQSKALRSFYEGLCGAGNS